MNPTTQRELQLLVLGNLEGCSYPPWKPITLLSPDELGRGYAIELAKCAAKSLGARFVYAPSARLLGRVDHVMADDVALEALLRLKRMDPGSPLVVFVPDMWDEEVAKLIDRALAWIPREEKVVVMTSRPLELSQGVQFTADEVNAYLPSDKKGDITLKDFRTKYADKVNNHPRLISTEMRVAESLRCFP